MKNQIQFLQFLIYKVYNNPFSMSDLKDPFLQARLKSTKIVVRYAVHMHPLTQIQTPDLYQRDRYSILDITCQILYTSLPIFLCYLLNAGSGLINIFWIGNHEDTLSFTAIFFGTIYSNIFVYYIIQNVGIGLSFVSSYFDKEKVEVGYMYQKALGFNCFVCILITPFMYLCDKVFYLLEFDPLLIQQAGEYIWALVPSFYLYAFFQTTTSYLQSQGVIYPPLIFNLCGTIIHLFSSYYIVYHLDGGLIGAAWSKNVTDCLSALGLYLYIIYKEPTKESWVEWDIKATNNLHHFLKQVMTYEIYTFLEVLAFQIMCIVACNLQSLEYVAAHFVLSITYLICYFIFVSISHCINKELSVSIQDYTQVDGVDIGIRTAKKKVSLGVIIVVVICAIIIFNFEFNRQFFLDLLIHDRQAQAIISDCLLIFYISLVLSGLQVVLLGVVKTLQVTILWKISLISYYLFGIGSTILIGYFMEWGVQGIWIGWSIGSTISLLFLIKYVSQIDWQQTFSIVRNKFKTIQDNIRESRMEFLDQEKNQNELIKQMNQFK